MCFNTSHVTLYRGFGAGYDVVFNSFNTSHVTLYLNRSALRKSQKTVSIHPMLLFIVSLSFSFCLAFVSIHPMLLFIKLADWNVCVFARFNTSHVTLYRCILVNECMPDVFQYIPCYSLSHRCRGKQNEFNEFQYIPCYSLSASSV